MEIKLSSNLSEKQKLIYDWCSIGNGIQVVTVATGRQVGKTTIGSVSSVSWCLGESEYQVGFFLPTYKQCKNVFKRVKKMLTPLGENVKYNQSDYTVNFWNGSSIQFFTADNDNCRGFTFDAIVVDEACFIKGDIWQEAIQPTVAVSLSRRNEAGEVGFFGKVLLTSTPKTKNWFFDFVEAGNTERARVTRFTSEEGGLISAEFIEQVRKQIPEQAFKNEYLGEFMDAGNGLFMYLGSVLGEAEYRAIKDRIGVVAGLDVASKNDYACLTIQNKNGDLIFIDRWKGLEYNVMLSTVEACLRRYGSPVCYVETNGVGQMPFEELRRSYGRVMEWSTTAQTKPTIIQKLQVDFASGSIRIPDLDYLKNELDFFTCEWKDGRPKYAGSNGYHDDTVMSLAICNYNRTNLVLRGEAKAFASKSASADNYSQNRTKRKPKKDENYSNKKNEPSTIFCNEGGVERTRIREIRIGRHKKAA